MNFNYYLEASNLIKINENLCYKFGYKNFEKMSAKKNTIQRAEKNLKYKFPKTYRKFLENFGMLEINGIQIYGILGNALFEENNVEDVVELTLNQRKEVFIPENYLIISELGDGEIFCLSLNNSDEDNQKVVAFTPGMDKDNFEVEEIADSFGEFLYKIILDSLQE